MSSIPFGVRGGSILMTDEVFLVQGQAIAASSLTSGSVTALCVAPAGVYIVVTEILLRTKTAITGATVVPTVTAGWSTAANTLVSTATAVPIAAGAQTLLPIAVGAIQGSGGATLNLKVANTSAVGSATGTLYVDVIGYQAP